MGQRLLSQKGGRMIRKPTMQVEHMEQANVRHGYSTRRPAEMIEQEQEDEDKKRSPK